MHEYSHALFRLVIMRIKVSDRGKRGFAGLNWKTPGALNVSDVTQFFGDWGNLL